MNTIKKILIPVDFSDSSIAAINYVVGMVKNDKSIACDLIYIASHDTISDEIHEIEIKLIQLKVQYFDPFHIVCDVSVKKGELNAVLSKAKEELKADLILMGTAGAKNENEESHTSRLLEDADLPVLVIPCETSEFEMKNIALALDEKEIDDSSSLGVLHDIAKWYNAKIHLLTIDKDNNAPSLHKNADTLEYYLDELDYHYNFPKNSDIEKGIQNYVSDKNIDILAILPRNHAKRSEPSEGKLTKMLALHCTKPLLVID